MKSCILQLNSSTKDLESEPENQKLLLIPKMIINESKHEQVLISQLSEELEKITSAFVYFIGQFYHDSPTSYFSPHDNQKGME